jgi:hypothetical protein
MTRPILVIVSFLRIGNSVRWFSNSDKNTTAVRTNTCVNVAVYVMVVVHAVWMWLHLNAVVYDDMHFDLHV